MLYLIQAGEDGPVKIGVAKNPASRLRELQTAQAETLRLVETLESHNDNERILHGMLSDYRIRGEWFRPDAYVFNAFEQLRIILAIGRDQYIAQGVDCPRCAWRIYFGQFENDDDL